MPITRRSLGYKNKRKVEDLLVQHIKDESPPFKTRESLARAMTTSLGVPVSASTVSAIIRDCELDADKLVMGKKTLEKRVTELEAKMAQVLELLEK